jgi:hypothetical protein
MGYAISWVVGFFQGTLNLLTGKNHIAVIFVGSMVFHFPLGKLFKVTGYR